MRTAATAMMSKMRRKRRMKRMALVIASCDAGGLV
jgi:hypothetical protein